MRVLLLGGTGAIGSNLAYVLSNKNIEVTITSRKDRENTNTIKYIKGNAKDLMFLQTVLSDKWDSIVDFMKYSQIEFEERIELLLSATFQYIYLSSARVYDDCNENISENHLRLLDTSVDQEFLSSEEYSLIKAKQENYLFSSKMRNWTIVRPYITYDTYRLQLGNLEKETWLYRALQGKTICLSKDMLECTTTLTYGGDVAKMISNIIGKQEALSEVFNLMNNMSCKWSDVLNLYLDTIENKTGKRPNIVLQTLPNYLSWNDGKYQIIYDRLFNRRFDNSRIKSFCEDNNTLDVYDGLKSALNSFIDAPKFSYINWKYQAKIDKQLEEMTPLSEIENLKQKIKYIYYRYIKR